QPAAIVVRQKFRLVRGHVDVHRTIALATLARQAQVERLAYRIAAPAVRDRFAAQHLEQHARTAARGMLLFARGLIARAHGAAVLAPAVADADATQRRAAEIAAVAVVAEMRLAGRRVPFWTEAQIAGGRIRRDDLARIHAPGRIPDALELGEGVNQFGPE